MTRRNYFVELKHLVLWSTLAGLVEGQFGSIVVAKAFGGGKLLITVATATPAAAYMFSLFWGLLCVGRPKIRLFTFLASSAALVAATVAAVPPTPAGGVWFVVQMALAQVLLAGVVTVRSALWKSNYPTAGRGRITARLQAVRFVASITTVLIAAWVCDRDATFYRYAYPCVAVVGMAGVWIARSIHIRGERAALRRHRPREREGDLRAGLTEPFSLTALLSPGRVIGRMVDVLRRDRRFARYLLAQSFTGLSNFMTIPVVVAVVTLGLDMGCAWGFWVSCALIQAIPQLLRLGSLNRWASLFDRVGVVRFRVVSVSVWAVSLLFGLAATVVAAGGDWIGAAALPLAVALFALRGVFNGVALGAGALAWNLGHLHFARADEAEVYMGIHVFLTGLRGLIAPAGGMLLWSLFGSWVWIVAIAFALTSIAMYSAMARQEAAAPVEAMPLRSEA